MQGQCSVMLAFIILVSVVAAFIILLSIILEICLQVLVSLVFFIRLKPLLIMALDVHRGGIIVLVIRDVHVVEGVVDRGPWLAGRSVLFGWISRL